MVTLLLHTLVCSHFRVSSFRSSRGEPLLTPSLNLLRECVPYTCDYVTSLTRSLGLFLKRSVCGTVWQSVPDVLHSFWALCISLVCYLPFPFIHSRSTALPNQHPSRGQSLNYSTVSLARMKRTLTRRQNSRLSCSSTGKVKNLYMTTRSPS